MEEDTKPLLLNHDNNIFVGNDGIIIADDGDDDVPTVLCTGGATGKTTNNAAGTDMEGGGGDTTSSGAAVDRTDHVCGNVVEYEHSGHLSPQDHSVLERTDDRDSTTRNSRNNVTPSTPPSLISNSSSTRMRKVLKTIGFVAFMIGQGGFFFFAGQKRATTNLFSVAQSENETVQAPRKPTNSTVFVRTKEQTVVSSSKNSSSSSNSSSSLQTKQQQQQQTEEDSAAAAAKQQQWEPFNTTNPHIDGWCPLATCRNSPMCAPCQRRFLLIIATGRSGSTSLLRMMNLLPGVRLSGENNNQLLAEKQALDNLWKADSFKTDRVEGPWAHNEIPDGSLSCPIQKMFEAIDPPEKQTMTMTKQRQEEAFDDSHEIIGFKTIRFHVHNDDLEESVRFVKTYLPCVRVLLNFRSDVEGQTGSISKWFGCTENCSSQIRLQNEQIKTIAGLFGRDYARLLDMSNWTNPETGLEDLNDAVEWLGFRDCRFPRLYHENKHGYDPDPNKKTIDLGRDCHYSGKEL